MKKKHDFLEKKIFLLMLVIFLVISFGGLVEIVPLFFEKNIQQPIKNLKPLSSLALEGRDIYIREGCHVCHTQMVRKLYFDIKRYGHYSLAEEHIYEHPFLWGSKRTGPDLSRIGGRYSDSWHKIHLRNPRIVVPSSKMPSYIWLSKTNLDYSLISRKMKALSIIGVPYSIEDIKNARYELENKTEEDALIFYLQQLGLLLNKINIS